MSKNTDQLYDRCRVSRGIEVKDSPKFLGSLSSCKVGIVFDKAQATFRAQYPNGLPEPVQEECRLTTPDIEVHSFVASSNRENSGKEEDAFTRTLKLMKRNTNPTDLSFQQDRNATKRKLEKQRIPETSIDEIHSQKRLKNEMELSTQRSVSIQGNMGKPKNNKVIRGGYQDTNIDYLFEDEISSVKNSDNGLNNVEHPTSSYAPDSYKKLNPPKKFVISNQMGEQPNGLRDIPSPVVTGSVFSKFKRKPDSIKLDFESPTVEKNANINYYDASRIVVQHTGFPPSYETLEKNSEKILEPTTKRTLTPGFTIPKKNSHSLTKAFNSDQYAAKDKVSKKTDVPDKSIKLLDSNVSNQKNEMELHEKKTIKQFDKRDARIATDSRYSSMVTSVSSPRMPLPNIKSDLLSGNKFQGVLAPLKIDVVTNDVRNANDIISTDDNRYIVGESDDSDYENFSELDESVSEVKEVEINEEYNNVDAYESIQRPQKLYSNKRYLKVGVIFNESLSDDDTKAIETQTIPKETISSETQTPAVRMVSVGTQTLPSDIKRRSVCIQAAIHCCQSIGTQTRVPKTSSSGTQTNPKMGKGSQTVTKEAWKMPKGQSYESPKIDSSKFDDSGSIIISNPEQSENIKDDNSKTGITPIVATVSPFQRSNNDRNNSCKDRSQNFEKSNSNNLRNVYTADVIQRNVYNNSHQPLSTTGTSWKKQKQLQRPLSTIPLNQQRQKSQYHDSARQLFNSRNELLQQHHQEVGTYNYNNQRAHYEPEQELLSDKASHCRQECSSPGLQQQQQQQKESYWNELSINKPSTPHQYSQEASFTQYRPQLSPCRTTASCYPHNHPIELSASNYKPELLSTNPIPEAEYVPEGISNEPPIYGQEFLPNASHQIEQIFEPENNISMHNRRGHANYQDLPQYPQPSTHIYSQEDSMLQFSSATNDAFMYSSSAPVIVQEFPESYSNRPAYDTATDNNSLTEPVVNKLSEYAIEHANNSEVDNTDFGTTSAELQPDQSSLEYSPSMIERVLNIIHGR